MLGDFSSGKERIFTSLRQYQKLIHIAQATRKNALFVLASGNTGVGKTTTMRQLYAEAPHTFYIKIEDDLTWRELLRKIAISLGIKDLPYRTEALREAIQQRVELLANEHPLLIIDEAEELTDSVAIVSCCCCISRGIARSYKAVILPRKTACSVIIS